MTERILVAAFLLLMTPWMAQKSTAQAVPAKIIPAKTVPAEVISAQIAKTSLQEFAFIEPNSPQAAALDQKSSAQSASPSSADKGKSSPASTPAAMRSSSTVGNPASSTPLNVKGKLRYFAVETFRPGIYPVAAFYDGLTMAAPPKAYPHEWRAGFPAFARNYGDFMGSWAAVQGGKFVVASLAHEDPRYFPSQSKNFFARCFHAARYAVIDRGDNGRSRLALANISGAFAGGFVGNAYLPDPYANASHALSRSALGMSGFATSNLADEFWPDIHRLARKLHVPLFGY